MGKNIETTINRFDGGIVNDARDLAMNSARIISNFDIITNVRKMTPYRSSESGDDAPTTSRKQNFCIALRTGTTYSIYALGVVSGQSYAEVLYKNLTTGAANDLDDNAWAATANNQSASGAASMNCFIYYAKTGLIYGGRSSRYVWAYDPSGVATFADTHVDLTSFTNIGQGLIHSKDDILYIPYDNKIMSKNGSAAATVAALTLPTHYVISSICEYGNYLAIACSPLSGIGNSRVYLWDRDSTLTTLNESIDWGVGTLKILEEIDGDLVGISQLGGASTGGIPTVATTSFRDKIIFRRLIGSQALKFLEVQANHAGSANTLLLPNYKQKVDNRLFFQMLIELNGSVRDGLWSIGRSTFNGNLVLIHELSTNNNTGLTTSDNVTGFFSIGSFFFQSYISGGSYALTKTDDGSTYSHNSVYESKIFNGGDPSAYKDLIEITVTTEYMPTAGQITLAYRTDQNTEWTTIFTNTTDNSISHTANNIESSGAPLPKYYKEIQFRILSTGGAEVTGLLFKEDITGRKFNVA